MTPSTPDLDTVHAKLRLIEEALEDLRGLGEMTEQRLREDRILRAAVERLLSRVVDLAVAVNTHMSVALLDRAPATYRESFELARRAELLDGELAARLAPSTGLRDAIVHTYVDLDLKIVAEAVEEVLEDYGAYVRQVAASASGS